MNIFIVKKFLRAEWAGAPSYMNVGARLFSAISSKSFSAETNKSGRSFRKKSRYS